MMRPPPVSCNARLRTGTLRAAVNGYAQVSLRDFASEADYDQFLDGVLVQANGRRREKVAEELAVMRELPPTQLSEYDEVDCRVGSHSTIRVKKATCSVPRGSSGGACGRG